MARALSAALDEEVEPEEFDFKEEDTQTKFNIIERRSLQYSGTVIVSVVVCCCRRACSQSCCCCAGLESCRITGSGFRWRT